MEFLNKVELRGVVGRVNTTQIMDFSVTNFSLVTERVNVGRDGMLTTEVTWFNCTTYNKIEIHKGDKAHVLGRLRVARYEDGTERVSYEVVVNSVTILEK